MITTNNHNNNKTRGRTLAEPTLQDLVKRSHTGDLNPYALNVTITMMVHMLPNATSATELAIWLVTIGVLSMPTQLTTKGALRQVRNPLAMNVEPKDTSRGIVQNLKPIELGSFDAIIGMDWLAKYQAIIVYAEKIVHIPWGNETLIVRAHVTTKEIEDKLEKKRLEDVPIIRDFPEIFPEDLPGLPPTRQVEFKSI
ncbi:putative reverse transcriptase domain-containing protein [Tanacetum coccineum]